MSTSQLRSTCMEHRISARYKGFAEFTILRILPYFYMISRKNGVKMRSNMWENGVKTEQYNADTVVTLKDFPKISMTFAEMFENVE